MKSRRDIDLILKTMPENDSLSKWLGIIIDEYNNRRHYTVREGW